MEIVFPLSGAEDESEFGWMKNVLVSIICIDLMGLEILFRDSIKSYRSSHKFNHLSKICGLYAFSLMPDLRVVLSVEGAQVDSDTNPEQNNDHRAYIQSSSLKFNSVLSNNNYCASNPWILHFTMWESNYARDEYPHMLIIQLLTIDFYFNVPDLQKSLRTLAEFSNVTMVEIPIPFSSVRLWGWIFIKQNTKVLFVHLRKWK